jgi:hypothetical protein
MLDLFPELCLDLTVALLLAPMFELELIVELSLNLMLELILAPMHFQSFCSI